MTMFPHEPLATGMISFRRQTRHRLRWSQMMA